PSIPEKLITFALPGRMTNWHLCNYFAPGGLLGVPAVSAITVPTATPAPTMAPTLSTIVRTRRCLAGAIATPAGWAAVTPFTLGASAAAVPTGRCGFWA